MYGREHAKPVFEGERVAPVLAHRHWPARETLCRGTAQGDNEARLQDIDLAEQPPLADVDLTRVRLLVQAELAGGSNLKCLTALVT